MILLGSFIGENMSTLTRNRGFECGKCQTSLQPRCHHCKLNFDNLINIMNHKKLCHTFKKEFKCSKCMEKLNEKNISIIYDNRKFDRNIFQCKNCTRTFDSHKQLINHNRIEHELKGNFKSIEKYLTCVFCGIIFITIASLKNHMLRCRSFKINFISVVIAVNYVEERE